MKKLLSLFVLAAMLLAACGSGSGDVAATVDGNDITVNDVESLLDAGGGTVEKTRFAEALFYAIQWDLMFKAAEADYGVTVSDEAVTAEAENIYVSNATEGQTREDFLATNGITEEFLSNFARQQILFNTDLREVFLEDVPEPTQEEIDAARQDAVLALTNACVSHVLVETEEEANAVMTRLEGGEAFEDVAREASLDTGSGANGGVLPCGSPSGYVEPFRDAVLDADVGDIYPEPVESQFGWHVILVTERTEPEEATLPTDEELAETVRQTAVVPALQDWFTEVMKSADVTVEEAYGTWETEPPGVTPPADE